MTDRHDEGHLALVRQSYAEVLDATKHQDEKIGRYLAALAFLTTGAVTLLFRGDLIGVRFTFPSASVLEPQTVPLVAWFASAFFVSILASLVMLLNGLGSPLRIPGKKVEWGPDLGGSRLFFAYIGSQPVEKWQERWRLDPQSIRDELLDQYILETHNLAERARTKYQHVNEASAMFVLALFFLFFTLLLAIKAAVELHGTASAIAVSYGPFTALAVGFAAVLHVFLLIYARTEHDRRSFGLVRAAARDGHGSDADSRAKAALAQCWLLLTVPAFVAANAYPSESTCERVVASLFAVAAVFASFTLTRPRWRSADSWQKQKRFAYGALVAVVSVGAISFGGVYSLAMALLPGAAASLLPVRDAWSRNQDLRKRLQEKTRDEKAKSDLSEGGPGSCGS